MWEIVLKSFYFALPAYLANMSPVIFDKFKILIFLAKPIDGGHKIGKNYIFGISKTWRGIVSAVIFGVLISGVQAWLYYFDYFKSLSIVDYPNIYIIFGILAGLGAIVGDLIKSFFKRRLGKKSSSSWPVFDQLDFIAGFFVFTSILVLPSIDIIITVFILTLILHPVTNVASYYLGFKKVWW